jgi:hypothetical protein
MTVPGKDFFVPIQPPFSATTSEDNCFTKGVQSIYLCRTTGCYFFARSLDVSHDYQAYYPYLATFNSDRVRWEVDIRRAGFLSLLGTLRKHTSGVRLLDVGARPCYFR